MLLVIAVVSGREVGRRGPPQVGVNNLLARSNVGWDSESPSRPKPNSDAGILATCEGIESASCGVELLTVRARCANSGSTASVGVDPDVTVRRDDFSASIPVSYLFHKARRLQYAYPVWRRSCGMVHPGRVCSEIRSRSTSFTPYRARFNSTKFPRNGDTTSMMSISPPVGQGPFRETVQKAGQVAHP